MKNIVIVGASTGLGYAVAEALASRGVKVGLTARHTESLRELKKKYPDTVEYVEMDITHPSAVGKLNELAEKIGGMDIYFHAAGIGQWSDKLDPENEVAVVKTNALGFARMISAAYAYFRDKKRPGQIAALTSVAGTKGIGKLAAYSACKRFDSTYLDALEQLSNIQKVNVAFTDIRPGWVRTPLLKDDDPHPHEMTVDYVLPQILRAIVKRKRVAIIDWHFALLVALMRLVPNCIWTRLNPKI